jgi:division protein 1
MDILWALSNPIPTEGPSGSPRKDFRRLSSQSYLLPQSSGSSFVMPAPPSADGSWDMYQDFVGGVQFWGYAMASGSADACVRMWDSQLGLLFRKVSQDGPADRFLLLPLLRGFVSPVRTGQAHRTLVGHTAPVTCLQFDEYHLVSGSLDKTVKIWDLRTGSIADTLKYEHPITALQFDSRKIVAAAGENGIRVSSLESVMAGMLYLLFCIVFKVFNRTTMQHTSLVLNGHTGPVERLRFMDRYLASGARDKTVKLWSLP